ncbi:MAG: hypothetical protein HUJ29_03100 [Gammaproteobacteria bacterium]|nr:hypothetical protein [Gammaproteobacteria bacterium]
MEYWIAKFVGPVVLALSIPMVFAPRSVQAVTARFLEDSPLVLISGVLAMIGGLAIVNNFNQWTVDWTVIITLLGWALLLGGAVRIILPHFVREVGGRMLNRPVATRIAGAIWFLLSLVLTVQAYLA